MTKKRLTKIIVDILMFGDFIFLMSHANVRNLGHHAYGGIALFVLFVIHHILNIWFYKTATKGKYNRWRIMVSVTAYLLLVLMILMAISAVFASGTVFEFSPFIFSQGFRTLHLMSTSWGYMVMSFHVALHVHSPLNKLDKNLETRFAGKGGDKIKHKSFWKILSLIFYIAVIAAGIFLSGKSSFTFTYSTLATGKWQLPICSSLV